MNDCVKLERCNPGCYKVIEGKLLPAVLICHFKGLIYLRETAMRFLRPEPCNSIYLGNNTFAENLWDAVYLLNVDNLVKNRKLRKKYKNINLPESILNSHDSFLSQNSLMYAIMLSEKRKQKRHSNL